MRLRRKIKPLWKVGVQKPRLRYTNLHNTRAWDKMLDVFIIFVFKNASIQWIAHEPNNPSFHVPQKPKNLAVDRFGLQSKRFDGRHVKKLTNPLGPYETCRPLVKIRTFSTISATTAPTRCRRSARAQGQGYVLIYSFLMLPRIAFKRPRAFNAFLRHFYDVFFRKCATSFIRQNAALRHHARK